ncbi:TPA: VapC-like toxin, partial [Candidatus Bathyarchaeota archaeon]|nr:VapC-like toxin [Candidatus Bathyarchaeota archaeon]
MLASKEFDDYGFQLILFKLFGSLSRINVDATYEDAVSHPNFPIGMLKLDRGALDYAMAKLSRVTYDSLHAALAARNAVDVVVTED